MLDIVERKRNNLLQRLGVRRRKDFGTEARPGRAKGSPLGQAARAPAPAGVVRPLRHAAAHSASGPARHAGAGRRDAEAQGRERGLRAALGGKGKLNVEASDGIVVLRGEVKSPDHMRALEDAVRKIPGVLDVRSFLHLPRTPAPNVRDALAASDAARRAER